MSDDTAEPREPVDGETVARATDHVRDELVRFARALRRAGASVPANAATTAARSLVVVGFADEDRARAAIRATLVTDPRDADAFDRMFPEFWRRLTAGLGETGPAERWDDPPEGALAPLGGEPGDGEEPEMADETAAEPDDDSERGGAWRSASLASHVEDDDDDPLAVSRYSPTGSPSPVEGVPPLAPHDELDSAVDELTAALATLRGRAWDTAGDRRADARRALRASVGTGGTVVSLPTRDRKRSEVRATWLVDVSRSVLDTMDRGFLLDTLGRTRTAWRDCRVFFFDEDVREVTSAFDEGTAGGATTALADAEAEWGGGTRIGDSLAELRARSPDAVDNRTVVFVVSDGLEMGDVSALERELAWLSSRAAAVVWCNPLAASPGFEPTAQGMAAALPFVTGPFAFADPDDVAELARQLRAQGPGGRVGYEFDPRREDA
ncbi:VWA domain-containing protein [Haloarchaeobius baliensis]|uniref:VWA domain-containing protein n=1 Tax=Haloarchaeobius baliensis TaxID=1670458 RepID=UPI003F8849EA